MLADPRSEALVDAVRRAVAAAATTSTRCCPTRCCIRTSITRSAQAFKRETELFFDSLVREDRSVLDLLTADYTFVNERIARHYGIPNVTGNAFRRVTRARRPPRHPRPRQRADADVGRRSHVAGDARQVGDGSAARLAAAAAAADVPAFEDDQGGGRRQAAVGARAHGGASRAIRRARRATA